LSPRRRRPPSLVLSRTICFTRHPHHKTQPARYYIVPVMT